MRRALTLGLFLVAVVVAGSADGQAAAPEPVRWGWEDISYGLSVSDVTAVAVSPDDPDVLFVAGRGELHRSTDGGQNWERVLWVRAAGRVADDDGELDASQKEDLEDEARDEAIENELEAFKESLIDDLEDDVGRDLAEEIAEDETDDLRDELAEDDDVQAEVADAVAQRLAELHGAKAVKGREAEETFDIGDGDTVDTGGFDDTVAIFRIDVAKGGRVAVAGAAGLHLSFDGGQTFERAAISTGTVGGRVLTAAWDPADPDRIFAGTSEGVEVSVDKGASWTQAGGEVGESLIRDLDVSSHRAGRVLAGGAAGIFLSEDAGVTWRTVWAPVGGDLADTRAVAFDPGDPDRALAATAGGLLVSADAGGSFELTLPTGLTSRGILDLDFWTGGAGRVVVATQTGLFASGDGGLSFDQAYPGLMARSVRRIAARGSVYPGVLAATDSGAHIWQPTGGRMPIAAVVDEVIRSAPPLDGVAVAALDQAGLSGRWFQDVHDRAATAPWMPELDAVLRVNDERDGRLAFDPGSAVPRTIDTDDDVRFEVKVRWAVDGLLFTDDRLQVSATWRILRKQRDRILERVSALYGAWIEYEVRRRTLSGEDPLDIAIVTLAVQEVEAHLDALTGGYFGPHIQRQSQAKAPGAPKTLRLAHRAATTGQTR